MALSRNARGWMVFSVAVTVSLGLALATLAWLGTSEAGLRATIRTTARTSLLLFALVASASAIQRLAPGLVGRWLLAHRRHLGLAFAGSQLLHAAFIFALARAFPVSFWARLSPVSLWGGLFGYLLTL